jgi:hypothetical protein
MRRVAALIVLAAVACSVGLATRSAAATWSDRTAPPRTSIHLYAPFNGGSIARGIRVAGTRAGYCWTTSSADARSDAYRCFVGNFIHDPCFANEIGTARYVLCPLYTPTSKVLRINLTKRLPSSSGGGDPTRFPPWAVRTATGKWCELLTGATGAIAGMRINYGCTGGGILLGNPHRTSPNWTIFYAAGYRASQFRSVELVSVWW